MARRKAWQPGSRLSRVSAVLFCNFRFSGPQGEVVAPRSISDLWISRTLGKQELTRPRAQPWGAGLSLPASIRHAWHVDDPRETVSMGPDLPVPERSLEEIIAGLTWEDLVADGIITTDEIAASLRAKGLDPNALDHLYE